MPSRETTSGRVRCRLGDASRSAGSVAVRPVRVVQAKIGEHTNPALVFSDGAFDAAAFAEWTDAQLPSYARPVFVRMLKSADTTGTFKYRKADLVVDGHSADPRIPESDFRLARFAEGDLLKTPYPYVGAGEMR